MINKIKKMTEIFGVSGHENDISEYIKNEIKDYADELYNDSMGNLIAVKKPQKCGGKKLMLCAHMDINGLVATYIEDNGYIRISNLGSAEPYSIIYSTCTFKNGVKGLIVPVEEAPKELKIKDIYVDIGASSKKQAEKMINIGEPTFIDTHFTKLNGKRIAARGLDNRIGCYLLCEAIKNVKDNENTLYYVFSVQEELGLRGAKAAAGGINPDIGIAVDVTDTGDTLSETKMDVKLCSGAAIKIKDSSVICSPILTEKMISICKNNKIKYQLEIMESGGTDTFAMQLSGSGAYVGAVSIPTRFIHTGIEEIDLSDVTEALRLLTEIQNESNLI